MKKFHKSQRDPNPSRQVNPGLEKGYPARRVDPGWLLWSCKHLLQIDCTRVDPLRRVEANPGSCEGGLSGGDTLYCNFVCEYAIPKINMLCNLCCLKREPRFKTS